ncbi:MAG: OmpA family protein [Desulfotalea sp.]
MALNLKMLVPVIFGLSALTLTGCTCVQPGNDAEPVLTDGAVEVVESLDNSPLGIGEGRTSIGMLPVYYAFDSSKVAADQQSRLGVNADFMDANGDYEVRIEGNTDSRGTEEYNMALGERRAIVAKKALVELGVAEDRLSTVSYGEARALLNGQNSDAWAANRRSDFVVVE